MLEGKNEEKCKRENWTYWKTPEIGINRALEELKGLGVAIKTTILPIPDPLYGKVLKYYYSVRVLLLACLF